MSDTPRTVGLVACGKAKLDHEAPARDLYTSTLFRAASAYAEATYDEWWILSAKHYLVHPDTLLEPYDLTLGDVPVDEQRRWALMVDTDLRCDAGLGVRMMAGEWVSVFVHAGVAYRQHLLPRMAKWSRALIEVPLEGLGIGEQLRWYADQRAAA